MKNFISSVLLYLATLALRLPAGFLIAIGCKALGLNAPFAFLMTFLAIIAYNASFYFKEDQNDIAR